jgi:hypothetical protein
MLLKAFVGSFRFEPLHIALAPAAHPTAADETAVRVEFLRAVQVGERLSQL